MKICEVRNGFFLWCHNNCYLCLAMFCFIRFFDSLFDDIKYILFLDVNCWRLVIFRQRWKDVRSRRIEKVTMQCSEISIDKMSKIFSINHIQYVNRKGIVNFQVLFLFHFFYFLFHDMCIVEELPSRIVKSTGRFQPL